jgi:hypothetical protein
MEATVDVSTAIEFPSDSAIQVVHTGARRLQAGSALTISYTVSCGANCDAVTAQLANIASNPAAGAIHAQAIIDAINDVAVTQGFGTVVLATAAQVASTIAAPSDVSITLPPAPSGPQYLGCFNDNNGGRDLTGFDSAMWHMPVENRNSGGMAACAERCVGGGYSYMGLQWLDECFCGNEYGSQGEVDMSDCDDDGILEDGWADRCANDDGGSCGGRNAVYTTGYVEPPAAPDPLANMAAAVVVSDFGDCTYYLMDTEATFSQATDMCIMNSASPASVHSDADSAALWAAMLVASPHSDPTRTTNGAWVGYHDMHAEGCAAGCATDCTDFGFIWTDGSPSDYEYWSDGEPNDWNGSAADCTGDSSDGGKEDCTEIRNNRGGMWNDADCDATGRWFWCQKCLTPMKNPVRYEFFDVNRPMKEAEYACSTLGGHLASLHSQADQDLVNSMVDKSVWIGYHDQHVEGCSRNSNCDHDCPVLETGFIWSDGTANDYANWADGEPNDWHGSDSDCSQDSSNGGIEDCTEMWDSGNSWNDADCAQAKPYVCGFSIAYVDRVLADSCSYTLYNYELSMAAANDVCLGFGQSLASVHSQTAAEFMWAAMLKNSPHSDPTRTTNGAWVGYHDMHDEGCAAGCATDCTDFGFIWTDGSPSDYEYWSNGEPNDWNGSAADCTGDSSDGGNEDCTEIRNNRGGMWNDADCDATGRWFWCGSCPMHNRNPDSYELVDTARSMPMAEFECSSRGGHLASLHSQADQDLVNSMVDVSVWIGYHDQHSEGCSRNDGCGHDCPPEDTGFIWSDGTASNYVNWADGEPNDWHGSDSDCSQDSSNGGIEDCTEMWDGGNSWNDADCAQTKQYVCGFVRTLPPNTVSYKSFKFNIDPADDKTGLRGWDCCVQVGEVTLMDPSGAAIGGAVATNPLGLEPLNSGRQSPGGEMPEKAVDGLDSTKWLDFTRGDLILTFDSAQSVGSYDWLTANDASSRDPVKWTLEGSNDGSSWTVVDNTYATEPFNPTEERFTWQGPFTLAVWQMERVCEGGTMTLSCNTGAIMIMDATYGRAHGPEICEHSATSNQECHSENSVDIVTDACQGQTTCSVSALNSIFGDPCGGTYKYLTVNYICSAEAAPVLDVSTFALDGSAAVADGNRLDITQLVNSQQGFASYPNTDTGLGISATDAVSVTFDMYIGAAGYDTTGMTLGADGLCVNVGGGPGLGALGGRVGEDGVNEGVAVCFDEYANSNHEHGFFIHYNGAEIYGDVSECDGGWGNGNNVECAPVSLFVTPGTSDDEVWHTVTVTIAPGGGGAQVSVDMDSGAYTASADIAAYALPSATYLSFSARTGGAINYHSVRNIRAL